MCQCFLKSSSTKKIKVVISFTFSKRRNLLDRVHGNIRLYRKVRKYNVESKYKFKEVTGQQTKIISSYLLIHIYHKTNCMRKDYLNQSSNDLK